MTEGPEAAISREIWEETGLHLPARRLLALAWFTATEATMGYQAYVDQPYIQLVFDLGTLASTTPITLQTQELRSWRWATREQAADLLGPVGTQLLHACYQAAKEGAARVLTMPRAAHNAAQLRLV